MCQVDGYSLTGCSWIPVFYMERLPIWPPQPSYWATRYLLVRLDVRLSGFWLSVTTVKDLRMTAGTNGFTCFPRHGGVTPPTSKLRATTEKFLMEKPNNTFLPDLGIEPRTPHSSVALAATRGKLHHLSVKLSVAKQTLKHLHRQKDKILLCTNKK